MCRRRSRAPIGRGLSRGRRRGSHPARPGGRTCRARAAGRLPHRLDIHPPRRPQLQKKPCWRASKTIPASPASAGGGRPSRAALIRGGWSSSMKPGPSFDKLRTNMGPLRGWAPRGQRLPGQVPYGHWKTMTFLAALRCDRIDAPWVLDGPINGESFRVYVERVLAPALAQGDIVVMDNLGSHKGKAIRRAIRAAGARLFFLPPYSPDLNPIEQVFAKLKHFLRKAAERTAPATWRRIGTLLDDFSPAECANYFVNSGHTLPCRVIPL